MSDKKVIVLPGDGIGPEVLREARKVLEEANRHFELGLVLEERVAGGAALDKYGEPLPSETLQACRHARGVLHGTFGGPEWDENPSHKRPLTALLNLRKELDVYANIRYARPFPALLSKAPLKDELLEGVDIVIVREVTSGIYYGPKERRSSGRSFRASDTMMYADFEIERVARRAFEISQTRNKKLTCVDKANVLECSRLWRKVVRDLHREYPDVELEFMYVDICAMQLVLNPKNFDVVLTSNIFGDILSDEASAVLVGSVGVLPSATLGEEGQTSLFGPIHGPVNEIAGKDIANPLGTILSGALMLRFVFKEEKAAAAIERAVEKVLDEGYRSAELMTPGMIKVGCMEMGNLIAERLKSIAGQLKQT